MKKRILSSILTVCMVIGMVLVFPTEVGAATEGFYTYKVSGGKATITRYDDSASGELIIPSTLGGYPVTEIGNTAFYSSRYLQSVTIPEGVTTIGDYAFMDCINLRSVTMPRTVTAIGDSAFASCIILQSVTIPEGVTSIGDSTFMDCSNLQSVTIPEGITAIYDYAFSGCVLLESVNIPNSVRYIGASAFYNTGYYKNQDNWSENVLYIGNYLIEAETSIAENYVIPDNIKVIASMAFCGCNRLSNVTIGNSVITIGKYAFYLCDGLQNVFISASVQAIDPTAFDGCTSLTSINVAADSLNYCNDDSILYNKNKTELLIYPQGNTASSYSLPESVVTIQENSFRQNTYLKTIVLPSTLSSVGAGAFSKIKPENVLYRGTAQQWQDIDIASNNTALTNGNVVYEYDDAPARVKAISCVYNGNSGKLTAEVTFAYLLETGDLILAIYDNERIIDVKTKTLSLEDKSSPFEFDANDSYRRYTIKAFYWDGIEELIPLTDSIKTPASEVWKFVVDAVLESEHPYVNDLDETKTYTYDGDCSSIEVTFSAETKTEFYRDYIYIYDGKNKEIGQYTSTDLAGKTISVPGKTVKIRLTSGTSTTEYGYKTEKIVVCP